MRNKRLVTIPFCLRLVKGAIQALHLEYGSTQSTVVLITDIVPHGFLLIQARAVSSGSSLIWALLATSLWMLPQWLGQGPLTMGERLQGRGPGPSCQTQTGLRIPKYSSHTSPFWCMVSPSRETFEKCLKMMLALWTCLIRTTCCKWNM